MIASAQMPDDVELDNLSGGGSGGGRKRSAALLSEVVGGDRNVSPTPSDFVKKSLHQVKALIQIYH